MGKISFIMKVYDLLTKNAPQDKERINGMIKLIRETDDEDVRRMVSTTANEIKISYLSRKFYEGKDVDDGQRTKDAEILLGRIFSDSYLGISHLARDLKSQLQNIAWYNGAHKNPLDDWINAQKTYLRKRLDSLYWLKDI